jgi:hypothetical protein
MRHAGIKIPWSGVGEEQEAGENSAEREVESSHRIASL